MKHVMIGASLLALSATAASTASAEENLWVYAKGTDTRPKGSTELKLSSISRLGKGKGNGSYAFHDIRPQIEYGVTDRLTIGAELIIFNHNYSITNPDLNPMFETQDGTGSYNNTSIGGYELALKYNVLSPYKDAIGLSFVAAWDHRDKYRLDGADIKQNSVELMALLQKNFMDDTLVFAFNPKIEFERRHSDDGVDFVLEEEISLDISAGVSYRVAPKWFVGLEFRHQSDYLSPEVNGVYEEPSLKPSHFDLKKFQIGTQHQNGNYFGPTVHYARENWWATAGILFQFSGGGSEFAFKQNGKNFDEHEKVHIGWTLGYEF
ncbi:MAG: hypothetical protein COA69_07015 [Robiginitomaculum sp.]|nr:MAG: hypothetical protein COA69_07015 [Robiginitomaculum sp.]